MNIVVLSGGISSEREISIVSGIKVCEALREKGHCAILLDVFFGKAELNMEEAFPKQYDVLAEAEYIHGFDKDLESEKAARREFFGPGVLEVCKAADVVFMAIHGENGENGKVQAVLELMGIPYTGSGHLGSALAMDKGISKQLFLENGVPTPSGVLLHREDTVRPFKEYHVKLPCVVKPCCGGSSVGVSVVETETAFLEALEEAFSYEEELVVEDYIKGREFSVGIIDGEACPVIEIAPIQGFYDYKNKYQPGSAIETCPAEISDELTKKMQEYAVKAYHVLRMSCYGRIDFMMDEKGGLYCLEANTLPGMTPTSLLPQEAAVMGMSYGDLCEKLIEVSLSK